MKPLVLILALISMIPPSLAAGATAASEVYFASLDGTRLSAYVFLPPARPPKATVIALHGCEGLHVRSGPRTGRLTTRHQAMAELLRQEGYAVVFPDSLKPRGVRNACGPQAGEPAVGLVERRADALGAMAWVVLQPWARADRIALLGWSAGGNPVLWATDASQLEVRSQPAQPKVAIALYPDCKAALEAGYQPSTQVTVLLSSQESAAGGSMASCLQLAAATDIGLASYPDAYQDIDQAEYQATQEANTPQGDRRVAQDANRQPSRTLLRILEQAFDVAAPRRPRRE